MKKSQNMLLGCVRKMVWFWLSTIPHFAVAGKRRSKQGCAPAEKSVINMI
jgi:hypothetical protein